jgi:hypothetical protein
MSLSTAVEDEEEVGYYKSLCLLLGCSGMSDKCPGNKHCSILMKITHHKTKVEKRDVL